jgi:hypothetical protein
MRLEVTPAGQAGSRDRTGEPRIGRETRVKDTGDPHAWCRTGHLHVNHAFLA